MVKSKIINIPLLSYFGNKDHESRDTIQNIPKTDDKDLIMEPYCGSFALVRYMIGLYPDKYVCNDSNEMIINTYKTLQDDYQCNELIKFYKTVEIKDKLHYDTFKKENSIRSYLFTQIIYRSYGIYDKNKLKFNNTDFNRLIHFN